MGMITALCHGTAVGIYALLSMLGLAVALSPPLPCYLRAFSGQVRLFIGLAHRDYVMAGKLLPLRTIAKSVHSVLRATVFNGFLTLQPQYFSGLIQPMVSINTEFSAKIFYAITAMIIDISWYMVVVWLFSGHYGFAGSALMRVALKPRFFAWILLLLAAKYFFGSL